jgi:diguanylate cyclase (GGDEF)-like protein
VLPLLLIALLAACVAAALLGFEMLRRGRRLHAAEQAVHALAQAWSEDGSSRGRVCSAAQRIAGAHLAVLAEPTRRGDAMLITATSDVPQLGGATLPLDARQSLLAKAFLTSAPIHVRDLREVESTSRELMEETGVRAIHIQPVARDGRIVGVLVLGWTKVRRDLPEAQRQLIAVLADDAARAIERDAHVALLARQARTDELTALPNRRAWDEAVVTEMARAERTGQPLCVALLDLDHFKAYNDTHGHQAGDAHLRRTAAAWRRELRAIDVLARYGGEEFGVLLPNCDADRAREVIDRVREATPNGQTASAGVVLYDMREPPEELLRRADRALYKAKHAGRAVTVPA